MNKNKLTNILLILFIAGGSHPLSGQNLVPNNSFETILDCPGTYGVICTYFATSWQCGNTASSDLFNVCGLPLLLSVPDNTYGSEPAYTGDGYAGILCKWISAEYKEYLQVALTSPLVAGNWYHVSFYVSLADAHCGTNRMGAYFSVEDPYTPNFYTLEYEPQIEFDNGFLSEKNGWTLITGCFQAAGGEAYMVIGNFYPDIETINDPDCGGYTSYYYIDEVTVEEGSPPEEILFDLGDPVFACGEYEIDPGLSGYYFYWEDGSFGPTLTVTESGTYSLTISDGCNSGADSVEVTIAGVNPPVDIGPEALGICQGETYAISLDPTLNEYTWQDGTTGPDYEISNTGIYSVTLSDGCSTSSDEIQITVLAPPAPFELGEDAFLCDGDEMNIVFDPSLGSFLWQDGNTNWSYTIGDAGTYSLTISNQCGESSDAIVITALDIPDVNLGSDEYELCSGEILDIELDPSSGDILWQDGSDAYAYSISSPGIYSVSITNICGTGSDLIEVFYTDQPFFDLGQDTTLCSADTLLLDPGDVNGNFLWQDQSNSQTFVVDQGGTYFLQVSNLCGEYLDSVTVIEVIPVSLPDLGPDQRLCPGEQIVLYGNIPGADYLWQDLSTADSLIVNSAGTYTLQVSNACSQQSDTIQITVDASPPQVVLPGQVDLCQGETLTLDAGISGVSYLWNDNSQNQQLLVISPGTYSLTVSNSCGTDTDTTLVLDGGPAPFVELGNDIDLCPGDMVTLTPSNSNVISWLWQDGSTSPAYTVSNSEIVTVQVTNACNSATDTLIVNVLPATPPLDLGADTALCAGASFLLTVNTPGVNIMWPDGSTTADYLVSGPGQVYATISNSCGQTSDTMQVDALPDIPALNLGPDQSLCPGEIIMLNPGIADVTYAWQDGSSNNTFQTTQEGTIILTISNVCGTSTDTLYITESTEGPQVDLGPDIQVCEGETVTILSGISGVNYLWQDGSAGPDYITTQSGQFILQVSNNCGTDSDTLLVDISGVPPTPALGPDTTLCEGTTLNLISTADSETTILWQNGSSSQLYTVTGAGTYILSESHRCGDATDTIVVSYLDAPDPFSLGPDTTLCPGESIILFAPSTAFEIRWQDGSTQPSIIADAPNLYSLQLSNDCGVTTDEVQVDFDTRVPQLDPDAIIPWCEGDTIDLDATQPFPATYAWSTGESTSSIQVFTPGSYAIDVHTLCQSVSQQVDVLEDDDCTEVVVETHVGIYIPNVFSPNGDGINDVFTIHFGSDIQPVSVVGSIYDRWGNLVFQKEALTFVWDGNFAQESVMPGVYVYTLRLKYSNGGEAREEVFAGDVTLVK